MRREPAPFPWVMLIIALVVGFVSLGAVGVWVGFRVGAQRNAIQPPVGFQAGPNFNVAPDGPLFVPRDPPTTFTEPIPPDPDQKRELAQFFDRLATALADPDDNAWRYFDFERMYDDLLRAGAFRAGSGGKPAPSQSWFEEGAKTLVPMKLRKSGDAAKWVSADVRRVSTAESGEVAVYAVIPGATGSRTLMRFWFTHHPDRGWRLYDWQDIEVGLHPTQMLGAELVSAGAPEWAARLKSLENLPKALRAIRNRDLDEASDLLDECRLSITSPFDDAYNLVAAYYELQLPVAKAVETRVEDLIERYPDEPRAYLLRAMLGLRHKQYDEAAADAERYLKFFDVEPEALTCLGRAREGQGQPDAARGHFRKALAEDAGHLDALHGFRRTLPRDKKAEFLTQFLKAPKPHDLYDQVVRDADLDQDRAAVGLLAEWLHKERPNDLRAITNLIRVRAHARKPDEAIAFYKTGLKVVEDEGEREELRADFLAAMADRDLHLEAYAAVSDDDVRDAFNWLAYALEYEVSDEYGSRPKTDQDKAKRQLLDQLLAAHRKRVPADPWTNFFEGQQLMRAKDYAAADKKFADGLASIGQADDELEEFFSKYDDLREARTESLYKLGQGLTAHRALRPRKDTFDQLGRLYQRDKDVAGLRKLIDAHRAADATDALLDFWTAQLHWEAKEYEQAARLLGRYAAVAPKDEDDDYRYRYRVQDQTLRCYVRMNRPIEAKDYLVSLGDDAPPVLRALSFAANGNHGLATVVLVEECEDHSWMASVFYNDPDLAPHLSLDEYKPFRDRFPPPAKPK